MNELIVERRVQFAETDMARIVNFARFYTWMEEAEHAFFRARQLPFMEKLPDGTYIGWPRVSTSCHYESPARYDDVLQIRLKLDRIGVKSLNFVVEFWRDETRLAHGRLKTACCICTPEGTLRSIEIPEEYRQKLLPNDTTP